MKNNVIVLMVVLVSSLVRADMLCGGASQPVAIDLTEGERTTCQAEIITYSADWVSDDANAVAVVAVNGTTLSEQTGSGTIVWTPARNGTYTLTYTVLTNGVQVGETLIATFTAEGFNPETPIISPASGTTFDGTSLSVAIKCASTSDGATIHYTTDGSTPTMNSDVYSRFKIYGKTTVKAIAFYENGEASEMAVAEYARGTCLDPVISLADGTTFNHANQEVSIAKGEEGVLHYTLDGTEPTAESPEYTGLFTISDTTTIKAKVFSDSFFDSQVVTATLTRAWEQVATPIITAATSFTGSKTVVTLSCATAGATIRYTTNGNDPNAHSTRYTGPFNVAASCTVKAYAVLNDYTNSEIASFAITKVWGIGDSIGAPDRVFTSSGDADWTGVTDETAPQGQSLRSGAIEDNQTTSFSTTIPDAGVVTFKWKTSCERDEEGTFEWDHAEFLVDNVVVTNLDGVTDWEPITCSVGGAGPHVLVWRYVKDSVESAGEDCMWVADFGWTYSDALPYLGEQPRDVEIEEIISGMTDPRIGENVVTGNDYVSFRTWARQVKSTSGALAGTATVKASANAWLSYALDCDALLTKVPVQGEMKIAAFEKNASTGKFDFSVAIDGITVGAGATAENLATLFGIEGCSSVDGTYSAENVTFTFGTPVDGKVKISAMPTDTTATQFFLKVKMTP